MTGSLTEQSSLNNVLHRLVYSAQKGVWLSMQTFFSFFFATDRCSQNLCPEWLCLSGRWSVCRALESEIVGGGVEGVSEESLSKIDSCSAVLIATSSCVISNGVSQVFKSLRPLNVWLLVPAALPIKAVPTSHHYANASAAKLAL